MPFVVRIEHPVPSFERWKQAFDGDPADRKGAGVRRYEILRARDDPGYVMIDLDFDTAAEAERFVDTLQRLWGGAGRPFMQSPRVRVAERVEAKEL